MEIVESNIGLLSLLLLSPSPVQLSSRLPLLVDKLHNTSFCQPSMTGYVSLEKLIILQTEGSVHKLDKLTSQQLV